MGFNKILWESRGADKSAMGAMNRPLRGCAAGVGCPNEIFKIHYRAPTPPGLLLSSPMRKSVGERRPDAWYPE